MVALQLAQPKSNDRSPVEQINVQDREAPPSLDQTQTLDPLSEATISALPGLIATTRQLLRPDPQPTEGRYYPLHDQINPLEALTSTLTSKSAAEQDPVNQVQDVMKGLLTVAAALSQPEPKKQENLVQDLVTTSPEEQALIDQKKAEIALLRALKNDSTAEGKIAAAQAEIDGVHTRA